MTFGKRTPPRFPQAVRTAKASVHEAIGTLLGDDAVREEGKAKKRAAATDRPPEKP